MIVLDLSLLFDVLVCLPFCWCPCMAINVSVQYETRSTIGGGQRLEGGRGCNKVFPVLGGNGTKIAPTGDTFDQPPGQIR